MKNFTTIFNKAGFSSITFPIDNLQLELGQKAIFKKVVNQVFIEFTKVYDKNEKVFILARYQYQDGSFRSIHNGRIIILNNKNQDNYLSFLLETLDQKSNNYSLVTS
uniref:Uncharacterized protein n=1 Tax=Coniophora puteana TaxID=80637 RepID=A0A896Z9P7_9AGAM